MEIEAPPWAVAVWVEEDDFVIRFPDQQLIKIPVHGEEPWDGARRLISVLGHRQSAFAAQGRAPIGGLGAPVQYDIDHIAEHLTRETFEEQMKGYRDLVELSQKKKDEAKRKALARRGARRDKKLFMTDRQRSALDIIGG